MSQKVKLKQKMVKILPITPSLCLALMCYLTQKNGWMDDWWTGGWMVHYIHTTTHSKELSLHALRGVLGIGTGLTGSSSLLTSTNGEAEKQRVHAEPTTA